jgi:hypothetical protein
LLAWLALPSERAAGLSNQHTRKQCSVPKSYVVITQRDEWEDHYRLFEGLVSGAMVMTDQMVAKPKGITHGTQLIEFTSLDDLGAQIKYFLSHDEQRLAIARQGRRVAMQRHRAWHRTGIEEIIFGESLTRCSKSPNCPYIVHANEGRRR